MCVKSENTCSKAGKQDFPNLLSLEKVHRISHSQTHIKMGGVHTITNQLNVINLYITKYIATVKPVLTDVKQNNVKALVIVYD